MLAPTIRNSSIPRPDSMAATSQRGNLPRPAHVSVGERGLRYLGSTRGYFRRLLATVIDVASVCSSCEAIDRWIAAKRFSSSSFSARIRAESTLLISSCSDQRSSREIDSNAVLGADMLVFLSVNGLLHAGAAKLVSSSYVLALCFNP